jgi:acetyltransferase-like isoleucine patch superfamily enzyme
MANVGTKSIVAAGSVVIRDVEPYSIVGGNPAKVLKCRFPEDLLHA